jgi:membrane protease YdiL (CAAX protease family)
VAPVVEELTFRGLGFTLLSSLGPDTALFGTAVFFGLYHGFVLALPVFVIVGLALGWLRRRTDSVYPGMVMHGAFNAVALILAVSVS